MCGRFTLKTPTETIASLFPELAVPELMPRYNICPTQNVGCVRTTEGHHTFAQLRWGLVPFWAKDLKIGAKMINARSETVDSKPSFRNAFKKRRCLVFSDGYYEWKKIGKEKQPYYIYPKGNDGAFCMAGLWERWTDKATDTTVETCTILTTDSSPVLAPLHDRMPVVIQPQDYECWLDPSFESAERLKSLCKPMADDFMEFRKVDKVVNSVKNDNADCIRAID